MPLTKKNILIGVTGGIAAYKAAELVRGLIKKKATVRVVMTESSTRFISSLTLETLSQNKVYTEMWEKGSWEIDHIALSSEPDLFVIAPATANTIGKFAHGLADNLLTNLFLAFKGPVLLCPSMNSNMYLNQAFQENLRILRSRGVQIMKPESGDLACGDEGIGRLPEPDNIIRRIEGFFSKKKELVGKKFLVTAGPTREFLDPVRFLSNPSTGKMGYAVAEAAAARGAEVKLISGPSHLSCPPGVDLLRIVSAGEMNEAVKNNLDGVNVIIMTAAVSDYKPGARMPQKFKKSKEKISMELEPTPDILEGLGNREKGIYLVGFAAETEGLLKKMRDKMMRKNCALMIGNLVNSPNSGFESDENEVVLISRKNDKAEKLPLMPKRRIAEKIIDRIILETKS